MKRTVFVAIVFGLFLGISAPISLFGQTAPKTPDVASQRDLQKAIKQLVGLAAQMKALRAMEVTSGKRDEDALTVLQQQYQRVLEASGAEKEVLAEISKETIEVKELLAGLAKGNDARAAADEREHRSNRELMLWGFGGLGLLMIGSGVVLCIVLRRRTTQASSALQKETLPERFQIKEGTEIRDLKRFVESNPTLNALFESNGIVHVLSDLTLPPRGTALDGLVFECTVILSRDERATLHFENDNENRDGVMWRKRNDYASTTLVGKRRRKVDQLGSAGSATV